MRDIVERMNELRETDSLAEKKDEDPMVKAYELIQSYGEIEDALDNKVSSLMKKFKEAKQRTASYKKASPGSHWEASNAYVNEHLLPRAKDVQSLADLIVKELEIASKWR